MFGTSDLLGINYSDYATIRNGSYTKLMKAYYKKAASDDPSSSSVSAATSTSKDSSKTLANIESAADDLKKASEALRTNGDKSLFTKKQTTDKDGKVYSIPTKIKIPVVAGTTEYVSSVTDLQTLSEALVKSAENSGKANEEKYVEMYTPSMLVSMLYYANGST